jgi:hypothetical protein
MSEEEENNEEGPEQTEEVELAKFGEKVLRSPKYGAYERLVCQHLVLAVSSDPVNSICHSCRATLSLPKETMEKLKIDRDKVVDILTVALNFKTALELPRGEQNEENEDYDLIWSFAEQGQAGYEGHANKLRQLGLSTMRRT